MGNDVLNPFPAVLIHNAFVVFVCLYLIRRHIQTFLAIGISLFTACGISLVWKQLSFTFDRVWLDLLYTPIFEMRIFTKSTDDDYLGVFLFWIIPIILAWIATMIETKRKGHPESLVTKDDTQTHR